MAREKAPTWAVGRLLKEHIGTRKVADVAAEAGVGRTTLYNWLASTYPPAGGLARLRSVLGITHEELERALLEDEGASAEPGAQPAAAHADPPNLDVGQSVVEERSGAKERRVKDRRARRRPGPERA